LRPGAVHGSFEQDASDFPGAQVLRLRRIAQEGIDLSVDEQLHRVEGPAVDPVEILAGVEPDLRGHQREQRLAAQSWHRDPDTLPLEIRKAAEILFAQDLVAADMQAGQDSDPEAAVDRGDVVHGKILTEISFSARDRFFGRVIIRRVDIADIGETLGAEQLRRDFLGGEADALKRYTRPCNAHRCDFGRPLRRLQWRGTD
jgi:hypothetical protein